MLYQKFFGMIKVKFDYEKEGIFNMAHCSKYTRGAMGHLMKHYERAKDENGEYIRFGNQNIDLDRTELNYNLAPDGNQLERFHSRMQEVYCLNRKDVNVMCSWVVTVPEEVPEEHQREFFQRTYDFLEKKYGKENVISAYVHMDESTPHMHFAFIPVVFDKKKKREKVSAKELISKNELKSFHSDFQAEMDKFCESHENEFECNVLNGATAGGNLTVQELKARSLEECVKIETEFLEDVMESSQEEIMKLSESQNKRFDVENEVKFLENEKNALEGEIEALEGKLKSLDENRILLTQKFVELPKIKPIFEKFLETLKGQKQRVSVKSKLEEFRQQQQTKKELNNPFKESNLNKSRFDRDER